MKSPIGSVEYGEAEVNKRVTKSIAVLEAIARLPDEHIAIYLLTFSQYRLEMFRN